LTTSSATSTDWTVRTRARGVSGAGSAFALQLQGTMRARFLTNAPLARVVSAAVLDARADELEARARHLEEMQADSFREQRRRALAAQDAGLSGAMARAADQTRRATEQLSAVVAEGLNSVIITAPAPIQQFARDMDRLTAPIADSARDLLGIKLTRVTGLKGRRAVYSDELPNGDVGMSGGDNFVGLVGRGRVGAAAGMEAEPADTKFDDANHETSVRRATGAGSARGTPAGSAHATPHASAHATPLVSVHASPHASAPGSPAGSSRRASKHATPLHSAPPSPPRQPPPLSLHEAAHAEPDAVALAAPAAPAAAAPAPSSRRSSRNATPSHSPPPPVSPSHSRKGSKQPTPVHSAPGSPVKGPGGAAAALSAAPPLAPRASQKCK
jgi:hypothetical protein